MDFIIRKYKAEKDFLKVQRLIQSEGEDWKDYLKPEYKKVLHDSITFVAYSGKELCGFVRSICDFDLYIIVVDLLVRKNYRGNAIGKMLLEQVIAEYPGKEIYVMSDVDVYYEKLGLSKEGSIFRVKF